MQEKHPLWRRILRSVLLAVLALLLMAVFYVAIIMGQPQEDGVTGIEARSDQPLLEAMPSALLITDSALMDQLLEAFPAPVMYPLYGSALTLESGLCADVAFEGGLGRTVTLTYRAEEDITMTVQSIYPARAISLIGKGDYTISGLTGQSLAGLRSVRMENDSTIRLHAQGSDALYVVTVPKVESAVLRQLTASLQLYEGN
ncbi:MAG: hypothetical protein IJ438_11800 [Clostridia bacterium]|nr:hypothetical protein [Clostridia bacterium]